MARPIHVDEDALNLTAREWLKVAAGSIAIVLFAWVFLALLSLA